MSTSISFPSSPTNGQTYSYGGITYTFDGTRWVNDYTLPTTNDSIVLSKVNIDSLSYYIDTDSGGNLIFRDNVSGIKTLAQLASGTGGSYDFTQYPLTSGLTTTINFNVGFNYYLLLDQPIVFVLSNISSNVGKSGTIILEQDINGGYLFTEAAEMKTPIGGASIVQYTAAHSISILTYYIVSSTNVIINYIGNFA
jgi:hypothetical protein